MKSRIPLFTGLAAVAVGGAVAAGVMASSPEEWDKFRAQLVQACIAEAKLPEARVLVAPEGTASYGVALLASETADGQDRQSLICIARKTPEGLVDVEVTPPSGEWIAIK